MTTAPAGERTRSFTLYAPVVMGFDHHLEAIAYVDPEGLVQETVGRGWFPPKASLREHPVCRQAVETCRPAWSGPTPNVTSEGYHLTVFVVIPEGKTPDLVPVALLAADPLLALRIAAPEHREAVEQMYRGAYDFDKPLVSRRIRKDGREVWLEQRMAPFYNEQGRLVALEGIVRDITERKLLEEQLKHLSLHDALTGLYNRAYLDEELGRLEKGREYPITLLSLDVNGLKFVNDTLGHAAGDQLLRAVAEVLRASFRGGDVVARVGGDEFVAVLPRTDADAGERLVARLKARIEEYNAGSPPVPISVSLDGAGEGHLARVDDLVTRVGQAIGLRHRELAELRLLAQVHDLGKVAVPDSILFKPGRLTPEERAAVEDHAVAGHRIATASPQLAHVAELILHHHEWWNGRGYPCGLRGEDIPLACRIVAIVDAYDAMTSERPYRKAMTHAEAIRELRRCAGTQFDPSLVELFIGIVGE